MFRDYEGSKAIIADNLNSRLRSKHISVKLTFLREFIQMGNVRILHVGTKGHHADVLTNAFWRNKFLLHHMALMNLS